MISTAQDNFRNLNFEQYFFDKIKNLTAHEKNMLPEFAHKLVGMGRKGVNTQKLERKLMALCATNVKFAFVIWDDTITDADANKIFRETYSFDQWCDAEKKIIGKNLFILGSQSFSRWMMLSQFFFDNPYYLLAHNLRTPKAYNGNTNGAKLLEDNRLFFRSIYGVLAKFDGCDEYLKTYDLTKTKLFIMFHLFSSDKPLGFTGFKEAPGVQVRHTHIIKLLKDLHIQGYLDCQHLTGKDKLGTTDGKYYYLSGRGFVVLSEITQRLFKGTEL